MLRWTGCPHNPKEPTVKTLLRVTAVTTMLVLLGSAPAQAHEKSASTRITLNANKSVVDAGEKVKFRGRLNSSWAKCRKWKVVHLRRDGVEVASKKTKKNGQFQFTRTVNSTSNWRVRFGGRHWGTHPHDHTCFSSISGVVRVRVRGEDRAGGGDVAGAGGGNGGTAEVAGVGGAGGTEVLAAGGGSAVTGTDVIDPAKTAIALGAIGLVALFLARRRLIARPETT